MSSSKNLVQLNLIQINNGQKAFGAQVLFDQATFSINSGEHVGVIGPNGAGKSTLFKILINQEELDSGQLIRSQSLKCGYLSQHDHWSEQETGNSYLEKVCRIPVWQAKAQGRDLRVSEDIFSKPLLQLSGGYRMRIKLIGLLGMDSNLMLLDEPTNYLDLETTLLLERFLQNYQGAFLLISHDREVLKRTTDHILEVESGDIIKFCGNIDDYFEQKELLRSQLEAQAQNQALKRKAIMDFVSRFGAKATKAKQAQSRLKALCKMERIEFKPVPIKAAIQIPEPPHVGKIVVRLENAYFGYQDKIILHDVSLEIKRGDHIAIVGLNGVGKSTLLKGLAGTLNPLSGKRELGFQVELAIFNQHVVEVLNPQHTVYESLEESTQKKSSPQEIRNMAGSLLFSSDHINKKIEVLSGGEKSRVALGRILLQRVPFLLLDEPTNHLDFQTVEALTQALNSYNGTLLVVSHDRGFIRRTASKILEVAQNIATQNAAVQSTVRLYPGSYDEYVWSLQQNLAQEEVVDDIKFSHQVKSQNVPPSKSDSKPAFIERKAQAKQLRLIEKRIEECQTQIEKLESENLELNQKLANSNSTTNSTSMELAQKMAQNTLKIQELEGLWFSLVEERENLF